MLYFYNASIPREQPEVKRAAHVLRQVIYASIYRPGKRNHPALVVDGHVTMEEDSYGEPVFS